MAQRNSMQSSRIRRGTSATALALALLMATPALAQSDSSGVQGHADGVAAGTQVTAVDTNTGRRFTGTVDAEGNFEILGLRPSTYRVEVPGRDAQQTTVLVGQTAFVDFGDGKEIVVSGRQVREVRTQATSTNITTAQIENLPQNQRNFLSFASLAPGVYVAPGGTAQLQSGATSSSNSNVMLDGMSLKNPINHGGIFGQNFGLGNPFPQIAIQEYKVETQNFGAETGQTGSALVTAVTKSGGDEFHGSAFLSWQPKAFVGQPYFDKLAGATKPDYDRKQFGGELGGPIIPGVIHFYAAGEATIQQLPGIRGNVTIPIPANLASDINVTHNNDFKQQLYFGKLTIYPSVSDTINLSGFIRRENNLSDIDGNATSSHGRTIRTHQDRFQVQWQHNGDNWFNTLNISYDKGTQSTPSVGTGPEYVLSTAAYIYNDVARTGAHFFTQGDESEIVTIRNDSTFRQGAHTIKLGGQAAFMDLRRSVSDHFNGSYYYVNPGAVSSFDPNTATPFGAQINLQPTSTVSASNVQIGLYAQDEWRPDEHWTLNFGLRWDFETNANNNNYVTPAAIATALRSYPGWQARGIDPEDYISTGRNRKPKWDMFQPRIGFAYDVHGDRDLVFFGGAGRYYDRSLFIAGVIEELTNSNKVVNINFCTAPGTPSGCIPFTPALRDPIALRSAASGLFPGGGSVFVMNNETRMPYSDQFNLGVRKRLGDVQLSVTLSHVRSHDIFQFVRANFYTNGWYSRYLITDPAGNVIGCRDGGDAWIQDFTPNSTYPGCPAGGGQLAGFSGKLNRGMSEGKANYTAVYVQLEKPFTNSTNFGFSSTLTINRARTNDAQELNADEFYNGASQDAYGWTNVNGVPDWNWVTTANLRAPWGFILSGTATFNSGPRFGNIRAPWNSSVVAPDGACCYGNMGGPLSPKSFIGYKRVDLRVAKTFDFGDGKEMTVDFQVFNAFNWLNRTYSSWGAGGGDPAPLEENGQVGNDARSFQAGIKFKF